MTKKLNNVFFKMFSSGNLELGMILNIISEDSLNIR